MVAGYLRRSLPRILHFPSRERRRALADAQPDPREKKRMVSRARVAVLVGRPVLLCSACFRRSAGSGSFDLAASQLSFIPHGDRHMDLKVRSKMRQYVKQRLGIHGDLGPLNDEDSLFTSGRLDSL